MCGLNGPVDIDAREGGRSPCLVFDGFYFGDSVVLLYFGYLGLDPLLLRLRSVPTACCCAASSLGRAYCGRRVFADVGDYADQME